MQLRQLRNRLVCFDQRLRAPHSRCGNGDGGIEQDVREGTGTLARVLSWSGITVQVILGARKTYGKITHLRPPCRLTPFSSVSSPNNSGCIPLACKRLVASL